MLIVFLAVFLWPRRLSIGHLERLAFLLWFLGGLLMTTRGAMRLGEVGTHSMKAALIVAGIALAVGWAKGRYVLSRTSRRNRDRLRTLPGPARPARVYGIRSWATIGVMMTVGFALTWFGAPVLVRGGVGVTVGVALLTSSFVYLPALGPTSSASADSAESRP